MRLKPIVTALCAGALLAASPFASAKELKAIGVTVGDLANPFFVQITKGAELEARKLAGDNVKVTLVSSGYDLGQQVAQIDNFIAAKVDMIILNAADSKGIGPAVKRAKEAGIVVVAVDVAAEGADATITSDNTQAGELACKYISDRLNNKGNVVIINGPRSPPYKTASKAAKRSSKNTRTLKSSPPTRTPKAAGKAAWR